MPYHNQQIRVETQQCSEANATLCGSLSHNFEAMARRPSAGNRIVVGQAKRRLERRAGLKCDLAKIGDARRQPLDMSVDRTERDAVVGVCRPEDAEIPLVEGKMHMLVAEEVEYRDFRGLSCCPALGNINLSQAAHRRHGAQRR